MWLVLFLCRIGLERMASLHMGEGYTCVSVERLASATPHRISASVLYHEHAQTMVLFVFLLVVVLVAAYFFSGRVHALKKNI